MKIKTILGILLIIALVMSSIGVAAAETPPNTREEWDDDYPPSWDEDEMSPHPGEDIDPTEDGPPWLP